MDIGADESDGTVWPSAPSVIVRVSPIGNDANDGLSWATAKKTVQAGLDATKTGDQVWVAAGIYTETVALAFGAALYGGFAGSETDVGQRNWAVNTAVLDKSVVRVLGDTPATRVDGFTVRNGSSGGIYVRGSPTLANDKFTGNSATTGGGVYVAGGSPAIANSTISGNAATSKGGGIYVAAGSPTIVNSTIAGNTASTDGGGVYCGGSSSPTLVNTIVSLNSSGICVLGPCEPSLRCNCVYGNTAYNYSGLADPTGADGNISADPVLADLPHRNVHIQPDSPCVDAGDDSVVQSGWTDIDGQPRIMGAHVDIGADESDGTIWLPAPGVSIRVSPAGNDASDGLSWTTAKKTVRAGLKAAVLGDQVWVAAGTYAESITLTSGVGLYGGFAGSETNLGQRNWMTNVTTVSSMGGSNMSATTRVDGFTIPGSASISGSLTIANNTIAAGITCSGGSPTITGNAISGNSGSGISCVSSSPAITNSTIMANLSVGVYCYNSSPSIANCVIASNRGNGICCDTSSCPQIINTTIVDNADSGIYCFASSAPTIVNTIVAFNAAGIQGDGSASPILRYNCVYGNEDYDYSGVGDPTGTDGNISDDPLFVGVSYGNVHIQPDSPCVDAGDDGMVQAGWLDMDGQPRIMDAHVDIGADESDGTQWPGPRVIRVSAGGNDAADGLSWPTAKKTVLAGINAAAAGDQVWVAAGTYLESITLKPGSQLYGGFTGTETSLDQRDWSHNLTRISSQGTAVTVPALATEGTRIDGFSIYGDGDCGISCSSCWPTIANNSINGFGTGVRCSSCFAAITNNSIGGNSTGIKCTASSPVITGNSVSGNVGGISCDSNSVPLIVNNTIGGNGRLGENVLTEWGGISCSGSLRIIGNTITGNIGATGGGIYCKSGSPLIANNSITGNSAATYDSTYSVYGGGIYCDSSCSPTIIGNTISWNSVGSGTGTVQGAGIYCSGPSARIVNNRITNNRLSGGIAQGCGVLCTGSATVANNLIANNTLTGGSIASGAGLAGGGTIVGNTIVGNKLVRRDYDPGRRGAFGGRDGC